MEIVGGAIVLVDPGRDAAGTRSSTGITEDPR
jgi:hypothetical protein